jgi:hypothetical protein
MLSQMRKHVCLLAGVAAAVVTTIFVLPHILLFVYVCFFQLSCALCSIYYHHQGSQLDLANPAVRRGAKLNDETLKLAIQHIGPRSIDDIASAYFPPGTSVQDAITMLKATGHASIDGPRLFKVTRPDGKRTEWFGVRAYIPYAGPQVWFDLETDQPNPTTIRHARGSIMSVYL